MSVMSSAEELLNAPTGTLPTAAAAARPRPSSHLPSEIDRLQHEIEYKERALDLFSQRVTSALDANIDGMRLLIDHKRSTNRTYQLSVCALWLQLKSIEAMHASTLVTFLHTQQLQPFQTKHLDAVEELIAAEQQRMINPRRSRLSHFHLCAASDEFSPDVDSYVGFLIFSYDGQSKFILSGHHCQRGDIVVKQLKSLSHTPASQRCVYDTLFKWYFNRNIDEKVSGIGFFYAKKKWRFDSLSSNDDDLLSYEYRLLDMYLLTHWLTRFPMPGNVQEMQATVKEILLKLYHAIGDRLRKEQNGELAGQWIETVGSGEKDFQVAIEQFMQTVERQINSILKQIDRRRQRLGPLLSTQ